MSEDVKAPKKKGGLKKLLMMGVGVLVLVGAGVGGGIVAAKSGMVGGADAHEPAEDPNKPKLVKKGEGKAESAEGGEGHGEGAAADTAVTRSGNVAGGGDPYQSTYYQLDKDFTSNLKDSSHFVQVGIALSTNFDDRVITNVKNNMIPVRSAILMALSDASEDTAFTPDGKKALAESIKRSVNAVLIQKEGFGGIGNVYFTNFIVQ